MRLTLSKWHLLVILAILLAGCKSKRVLPEGSPVVVKKKELLLKVEKAQSEYSNIMVKATGKLDVDGQSQNFRIEFRILKDSLIWVEVADPVLGLKLARGLITRDSLFMINRIDREYFKGGISMLQQKFGINYGFLELQNALSGNLIFEIDREFDIYYVPGSYLLSTADPKMLEAEAINSDTSIINQAFIDPVEFKPKRQVQYSPVTKETYQLDYMAVENTEKGMYYPQVIKLTFGVNKENELRIALKKFEQNNSELRFPFNIPAQYGEMR